jgi:serine/threonine protein kinase
MQVVDGARPFAGEGGMGTVHEARHLGTGRHVALTLITPDALMKGPDIAARFDREARATGRLESRHVAQVLDTGRDSSTSQPYLVMELLRGEDLSQTLDRVGPLSPEAATLIVLQALLGLQKAHDSGIVHRDIKPANVFFPVASTTARSSERFSTSESQRCAQIR